MFRTLLVANRGEIACRIIRGARDLGLRTIAVFSDADRTALHVRLADAAVRLGPGPSRDSYLRGDLIIEAARRTGAEAIHPGYGFLSENAAFADAVEAAGLIFVGPSGFVIHAMGNKLEARRFATHAGVPVVPGGLQPVTSLEEARVQAAAIGYPIMLKAAAGGGGKGMRVVHGPDEFEAALRMAQGEARAAFSDDAVYLERFVDQPRHVEVQILADSFGHVVALGERDCSIQRRHQKVVEETPAPHLPESTRQAMWECAVKVATAVGYRNAGTVEFLVSASSGEFFFLEMNTRLQVEHPITEMVTGIDLVAEQLRIAAGEPVSFDIENPASFAPHGAAIECRIYSEDPRHGFQPSLGTLRRLRFPEGPWVRTDAGVAEGSEVPIYYDPMLAKLVVWGPTREVARQRLLRALDECIIDGVSTSLPLFRGIARHPAFIEGRYTTAFLDENSPELLCGSEDALTLRAALVSVVLAQEQKQSAVGGAAIDGHSAAPTSRWKWAPGIRSAR